MRGRFPGVLPDAGLAGKKAAAPEELEEDAVGVDEARRVADVEDDDVVESCMYYTTSQVCRVASGAKDTRRFAE